MLRYYRVFLLHFERVVNFRSRIFVWFLSPFINCLFLLIFWVAVIKASGSSISGWSIPGITSYYLILAIAGSFIIAHIEEDVAVRDIREGQLVSFLLKPISYFWSKFANEIPWRIMQGFFGVVVFFIFSLFLPKIVDLPDTAALAIVSFLIILLAFLLSFTFKMIVGITAFWLIDFWGLQQIVDVVILLLAGFIAPLEFFPKLLQTIALITPFPYMIYYPIMSLQSKLELSQGLKVIAIQLMWLVLLCLVYKILWRKGVKRFTGEGQ